MKAIEKTIGYGTFWGTVQTVFSKMFGIAIIFIVLNHLDVYEYGLSELALAAVSVFSIFALPGLGSLIIADMGVLKVSQKKGEMRQIFWNYFYLQFILATIAWAIIFFFSEIIANFYRGQISVLLKIASFSLLISPFSSMYTVLFSVYFKFVRRSIYGFSTELIKLILIMISFFYLDLRAPGLILATVLSELAVVVVFSPLIIDLYRDFSAYSPLRKSGPLSLLAQHGKWAVGASYINTLGQNMRLYLIRFFLGTEAVGLYSVAAGLISHTSSLFPLAGIISPIIPQYLNARDKFIALISKSIKYQLFGFLFLGLSGFFVFGPLINYLFPKYLESIPLYNIMLLALLPMAVASIFTPIFYARKEQKSLFYSLIIKNIILIILGFFLVRALGLKGIATEYVLTTLFFALERFYRLKRIDKDFKVSFRNLYYFDDYDRLIFKSLRNKLFSFFKA
jgi:O-antigen/teichoic acid export membrane protein